MLDEAMTFFDLDDVFELRSSQTALRNLHILRARRACEKTARQKNLPDATDIRLLPQET